MKTIFNIVVVTCLLVVGSNPCFALKTTLAVNKEDAEKLGIELRAKAAGPDAVSLEIDFKAEGNLKDFTHMELKLEDGQQFVFSGLLHGVRTDSGNVIVRFSTRRSYIESSTLSVVMRSPGEAGDHTLKLRMSDFVNLEKLR